MFSGRRISSIFIGGGTPSLAPPDLIEAVIEAAGELLGFEENIEITLEANPGSVDAAHFYAYRQAGINRLSMGVQSLNDNELKWLERIHNHNEAISAFETARAAGFDNINLDLMYGLPNQTVEQWLQTLRTVVELGTEHLSCYQLTVEPHTKLATTHARSPLPLPDDELAITMLNETRNNLKCAGFEAYEISNFAKPGFQCRHNDGYWKYHDYIGIGAGAAGKWDVWNSENHGGITRYSNSRTPESYIKSISQSGSSIHHQESLDLLQAAAESLWLGLRRSKGVDKNNFMHRFGMDPCEHFSGALEPWFKQEMIVSSDNHLLLTAKGLPLADTIASSLL